jgi:putative transposase
MSVKLFDLWVKNRKMGFENFGRELAALEAASGLIKQPGLMRSISSEGVKRLRRVKTTTPDPTALRHPDPVKRSFTATAPHQLWVTDLRFVPTRARVAYVYFIIDTCSRMMFGWRSASHRQAETGLEAIEMAKWSTVEHLPGLGVNQTQAANSRQFFSRSAVPRVGAVPFIGSVGGPLIVPLRNP